MSGYMDTKFCEACDEDYDWAAPECPGCVHRRHDEEQTKKVIRFLAERDEYMRRWEAEMKEGAEVMRERDVLRERQAEVRAWAASRIAHCEAVMLKYAEPRPDIPLEPVERRGELQALKAVLAILDGKEEP